MIDRGFSNMDIHILELENVGVHYYTKIKILDHSYDTLYRYYYTIENKNEIRK